MPAAPADLSLPLEIEDAIIDQLSDDTPTLRNCALTCKAWAIRSRFHLLRSVRIETRTQLDALRDYLAACPRRRTRIHSVTLAPSSSKELISLLGIFPFASPTLRKWNIKGAEEGDSHHSTRTLSLHKATLTHLRYTSVEELHLSHILFVSDVEFIRLIRSLPRLRHLQCAHIRFEKCIRNLNSSRAAARTLNELSSMDLHIQDAEDEVANNTLLDVTRFSLRDLVLRLHSRVKWRSDQSSALSLGQSKLHSLNFRIEAGVGPPDGSIPDLLLDLCQHATKCISTSHASVKEVAIHIHLSTALPSVALALSLAGNDSFLPRFRSLQLDFVGQPPFKFRLCVHLPPRPKPRGVVVEGTVSEGNYQQQVRYYSEGKWALDFPKKAALIGENPGKIWRTVTKSDCHSVVALAISPDRKWIVSGTRQRVILWKAQGELENKQHPEIVHQWIAPMDDDAFTRSAAFSHDSRRLAYCTRDPEAFVQVRDVSSGNLLAGCRVSENLKQVGAPSAMDIICRASCAWSRSPESSGETLTSAVFVPSQRRILVQVLNAQNNFRVVSTVGEITPFRLPSLLFSPDGRRLASFQTSLLAGAADCQAPPLAHFMHDINACTSTRAGGAPGPLASIHVQSDSRSHILSATFDRASTRFAAISSDHVLHVWELAAGTQSLQVPMHEYPNEHPVLAFSADPNETQLLSCSGGRGTSFVLTTRDAASGRTILPRQPGYHCLRTRTGPRFVFSDDGRHMLSVSDDGIVLLWRASDGSFVGEVSRGGEIPTAFAWSGDGRLLAWGTEGGGVVVKRL